MKYIYLVFSDRKGLISAWKSESRAIDVVYDIIMAEFSEKEIEEHLKSCGFKGYDEDEHDFTYYFSDIAWVKAIEIMDSGYNGWGF